MAGVFTTPVIAPPNQMGLLMEFNGTGIVGANSTLRREGAASAGVKLHPDINAIGLVCNLDTNPGGASTDFVGLMLELQYGPDDLWVPVYCVHAWPGNFATAAAVKCGTYQAFGGPPNSWHSDENPTDLTTFIRDTAPLNAAKAARLAYWTHHSITAGGSFNCHGYMFATKTR